MLLGQSSASGFQDQIHGPNKQYQEHSFIMQKGVFDFYTSPAGQMLVKDKSNTELHHYK